MYRSNVDNSTLINATDVLEYVSVQTVLNALPTDIAYTDAESWEGLSDDFKIEEIIEYFGILHNVRLQLVNERKGCMSCHYFIGYNDTSTHLWVVEVKYHIRSGGLYIEFFGKTNEQKEVFSNIVDNITNITEKYINIVDEDKVDITFTLSTMDGANSFRRSLECPTWDEIKYNYPNIQPQIDNLFNMDSPDKIGKFIFWHGVPGTGKSYLIRSAMRNWKNKATCYYITDPEDFFNNISYMTEVLLEDIDDSDHDENGNLPSRKFKLFIIEDGLNFILDQDADIRGAAISRFLNITDGILGQGIRLLFIVTSNRPLDVNSAVLRPGRCAQELEFINHTPEQAEQWLNQYDKVITNKKSSYALSELYNIKNGIDCDILSFKKEKRRIGI